MSGVDKYTKLLIHGDGQDASTFIRDSALGKPITTVGTANIYGSLCKFGDSSLWMDGNSDYATLPDSIDWDFGDLDFTIDLWVNYAALPGNGSLSPFFGHGSSGSDFWYFGVYNPSGTQRLVLRIYAGALNSTLIYDLPAAPTLGTWYHAAVVRTGGHVKLFWNGEQLGADIDFTDVIQPIAGPGYIGGIYPGATYYMSGNFDELRVSKGIARWTENFTPPTEQYTADSYTKLLCHFDQNRREPYYVVTGYGTAQLDTAQKKFGDSSLLLDGNSDYITVEDSGDWAFGSGNFTIDFWIRFAALPAAGDIGLIINQGADATHRWQFQYDHYSGDYWLFYNNNAGTAVTIQQAPAAAVQIDTWYHMAVVKNGNNLMIFQDGVQCGATDTTGFTVGDYAAVVTIGRRWAQDGAAWRYLNGWLDELRVSKGIARWTENFTPPDAPYTKDSYTKLLLHLDGPDASVMFMPTLFNFIDDESMTRNDKRVAYVGTAQIDTAQYQLGSSSLLLDGNSDYLTSADSADWYFATGNFTIDFWIKIAAATNYMMIVSQVQSDTAKWCVYYRNGTLAFTGYATSNGTYGSIYGSSGTPLDDGEWHHCAVVRNGTSAGSVKLYLDGTVMTVSGTDFGAGAIGDWAAALEIGRQNVTNSNYFFNGWIDELRISKGIARWTEDFTPPTEPYEQDMYTVLLMHFEGADGTKLMEDSSNSLNKGIVGVGTSQVDTAQKKFGDASILLDGNSDYLPLGGTNTLWQFGSMDFTIDAWVRFAALPSEGYGSVLLGKSNDASTAYFAFSAAYRTGGNYYVRLYLSSGSVQLFVCNWAYASAPSIDTWYHIALVKSGTIFRAFVDGSQVGSDAIAPVSMPDTAGATYNYRIGSFVDNSSWINGWVDEYRISRGIARWTSNFTPPDAPYDDITSLTYDEAVELAAGCAYALANELAMDSAAMLAVGTSFGNSPSLAMERAITLAVSTLIDQEAIKGEILEIIELAVKGEFDVSTLSQLSATLTLAVLAELDIDAFKITYGDIALGMSASFSVLISEASRVGYPIVETVYSRSVMQNMVDASGYSTTFDTTYRMLIDLGLIADIDIGGEFQHSPTLSLSARAGIGIGAT
jgi:hypothetical protein